MSFLKRMFSSTIKKSIEIDGIDETDFEERLRNHIDKDEVGFIFTSKREFYGTVSKNGFKIWRNKTFKNEDFMVYGQFKCKGDKLIVDVEFVKNTLERLIPIFLMVIIIYQIVKSIIDNSIDWRYMPFLIILLLFFSLARYISRTAEVDKILGLLCEIYKDKEITKK